MRVRSRAAAAATTLVLLAAPLAACGSDDKDKDADTKPSSGTSATTGTDDQSTGDSGESGGKLTKANFAKEVLAAVQAGESAHMSMTMGSDLQMEGDIIYGAKGTAMSATMGMGEQEGKIILVDETMYMQMPGMAQPGKWTKVNKDTPGLGQLFDQMGSFDPSSSVKMMEEGLQELEYVGTEEVDGEELERYKVTVDTSKVAESMGGAAGAAGVVTYDLYLDDANRMRRTVMEIQGRTIQIDITDWGKKVDIKAPPASDVIDMPGMGATQ